MQVQDGATQIHPQGPDHHLVEAVGRRDVVGGLLGSRQQQTPAVGPGPHQVVEAPDRRLPPRPDHEPVARSEAGAGDVTYEGVAVLSRARLRFLDATPRMAMAKATDTRASTVWMALKLVDLVSSPRMFRIRVTQMKIVQTAAVRRIRASVRLTGSP
jgi:hypothetical protein